ncbi:MAG: hypothetical protein ACFCUI_05020 [Bernardetiaceae bacterium]
MQLTIKTRVKGDPKQVFAGFDRQLFEALSPPFPPVRVIEFGGCQAGARVALELNFLFFKQSWVSVVTKEGFLDGAPFFVDCGEELPFFLSDWMHEHRVEPDPQRANTSLIVDAITFQTPSWLPEWLLAPAMWAQFLYRKPVYKRYFAQKHA